MKRENGTSLALAPDGRVEERLLFSSPHPTIPSLSSTFGTATSIPPDNRPNPQLDLGEGIAGEDL